MYLAFRSSSTGTDRYNVKAMATDVIVLNIITTLIVVPWNRFINSKGQIFLESNIQVFYREYFEPTVGRIIQCYFTVYVTKGDNNYFEFWKMSKSTFLLQLNIDIFQNQQSMTLDHTRSRTYDKITLNVAPSIPRRCVQDQSVNTYRNNDTNVISSCICNLE